MQALELPRRKYPREVCGGTDRLFTPGQFRRHRNFRRIENIRVNLQLRHPAHNRCPLGRHLREVRHLFWHSDCGCYLWCANRYVPTCRTHLCMSVCVGVSVTNAASYVSLFNSRCPENRNAARPTKSRCKPIEMIAARRLCRKFWFAVRTQKCFCLMAIFRDAVGCVSNSGHLTPDNLEYRTDSPRTSVTKSRAGGTCLMFWFNPRTKKVIRPRSVSTSHSWMPNCSFTR